ncbi:uncharacterized protein I206_106691 [Kwoniella pini CBS 10737]|uniref:Uncharacterized protein n=1 Tax=Kwoniella pini CBS 10737 TaxID=1296096 RepID=A0A1B9HTH5_9TREE|nr:uncharacterized protein I206_07420 [Kwoniella pini CBS 10737]OCF46567.1 hypothetical protein I206_07420 [Kwoniella pini CBS 10737]
MKFFAVVASLAAIVGTQASPIFGFGNLFHHPNASTSASASASAAPSFSANATRSAQFPSYTGRFNLTQVLEQHHVDLSNLRGLNVTQLLGQFGIHLPAGFDLDSLIGELEDKFDHHHNSTKPSGHSSTKPSSTRSFSKPTYTSRFPIKPSKSSSVSLTSATSSVSTFVPSSISSESFSFPSANASDIISLPVISSFASASTSDIISTSSVSE